MYVYICINKSVIKLDNTTMHFFEKFSEDDGDNQVEHIFCRKVSEGDGEKQIKHICNEYMSSYYLSLLGIFFRKIIYDLCRKFFLKIRTA